MNHAFSQISAIMKNNKRKNLELRGLEYLKLKINAFFEVCVFPKALYYWPAIHFDVSLYATQFSKPTFSIKAFLATKGSAAFFNSRNKMDSAFYGETPWII